MGTQQRSGIGPEGVGVETTVFLRVWFSYPSVPHPPFVSWPAAPEVARWEGVGERVVGDGVGTMLMGQGYGCERV